MAETCAVMPSVARAVWVARLLTSEATTAKPFPASPCARGFDGGVQRQKIGLRRDGVDQADHFADAVGRAGKFGDRDFALRHLLHGLRRDPGGSADLPGNLG